MGRGEEGWGVGGHGEVTERRNPIQKIFCVCARTCLARYLGHEKASLHVLQTWLLARVCQHMRGQFITPREGLAARLADVRPLTCVGQFVAGQGGILSGA